MKLTIVGSGDAFGSGGRGNTCFRLDGRPGTAVVDFGASALVGWNRLGLATDDIDVIVVSHLHGDHFGGLPFLLLECQFVTLRTRSLVIAGPPGTRARLEMACEALFPGMTGNRWNFEWSVEEIAPRTPVTIAGFDILTREVRHPSGAPSTAVSVSDGERRFAYSGDTVWVDALIEAADGVDLFICECYSGDRAVPYHIDWPKLREQLPNLRAKRICATHMGRSALSKIAEMRAAGLLVAEDGKSFDI